jgi:hypothetical protein
LAQLIKSSGTIQLEIEAQVKGGVKGNNTYQIVYRGASDAAMDGAGVRYLISYIAEAASNLHIRDTEVIPI